MASDVLGSGENRAYIYDRKGQQQIMAVPAVEQIGWGRVLGDVSQATVSVVVPSSGAERDACCGDLGSIHSWAHTLVVFRDEDRVWEGPVVRLEHSTRGLALVAWDVLGWTKKRRIKTTRTGTGLNVIPEAQTSVSRAYSGDDPNVLPYVQTVGTSLGRKIDRDVAVDSAYYYDDLSSMVDAGLRFTTVGRRIVLAAQDTTIGQTALLLPEQHILGEVTVIEDGEMLATAASARDDKGHAAYINGGVAVDAYYGLVESIVSTGAGSQPTAASITSYATNERNHHYPCPVYLSIPDGAVLNPTSPFPIDHLVPGTLVPAVSRATCLDVQATFMLTAVNVAQQSGGSEQVTVTLQPIANEVIAGFDAEAVQTGLEATL